jgi:PAS domain S-box-containing protein
MTQTVHVLRYVELGVFTLVALVAVRRWAQRRGVARAWLAATFGVVALALGVGDLLPRSPDSALVQAAQRVLVALIMLFPYCLYRFMETFERPQRATRAVVHGLVAAVLVATFTVRFAQPGEESRSAAVLVYLVLIGLEWVVLCTIVSTRLWRAGRGQPTVARRRMQMLATGAAVMAGAVVVTLLSPPAEPTWVTAAIQAVVITSALLFLCGYAPPRGLLRTWRARDVETMHGALVALAQATSPAEVVEDLLPRLVELVGAQGVAIYRGSDGALLGSAGTIRPPRDGRAVAIGPGITQLAPDHLSLVLPGGRLELWTDAYSPFFGRDEFDLLRSVGGLVHVTLERTFAHAREVAAREALAEAQQLAHLGSWHWSVATGVIEWSDEMYRIHGREPGDAPLTAESLGAGIHPDDRADAYAGIGATVATGADYTGEYRIVRADGSIRWMHTRGRALRDANGDVTALVGTAQDITEARRLDQLRSDFVANAAHELRTPLTTVSGMATLLASQRTRLSDSELDEAFDALGRQGQRARQLVTSLLDLSRLEAGRVPVQLAPVSVARVVAVAVETAPPPGAVALRVEVAPGLTAYADPDRLNEIMVNLLSNAYRYGGPTVELRGEESEGQVRISVADDGNGVPEDALGELFQPFSRSAAVTGTPGSGLGLAISHRLAHALGGGLDHERREPHGARFVVTLRAAG